MTHGMAWVQRPNTLIASGRGIRGTQKRHNSDMTMDTYVYVKNGRAELPYASIASLQLPKIRMHSRKF